MTDTANPGTLSGERADLLSVLTRQRERLLRTVKDVTDEQSRMRTTVSELCLAGVLKHVADMERTWMRFAVGGVELMHSGPEKDWANQFRLVEGENLAGVIGDFEKSGAATDELVATLDLDQAHPLPEAPWFEPGARWTNRKVLLHVFSELCQHAGHADVIREALDGGKSMG
jgi:uncharacterized damage-inducible protein DinB